MVSKRKHHHGTDVAVRKRYKSKPVRKTFSDLDGSIVDRILTELSLDELSNVALINCRLNDLVYKHLGSNCINKSVTIHVAGIGEWFYIPSKVGKFKFDNASEICKFLRTSGHLISKLRIECAPSVLKLPYQLIERAICERCSEVLTKIEISTTYLPVMTETTDPFPNVEVLELNGCELSANLCQKFNELFPSVRQLVLKDCKAFDPRCIEAKFPCLKELILFGKCRNRCVFTKYNIQKAIELNPRIRRLVVDFDLKSYQILNGNQTDFVLDYDFYRCVSECLPKLTSLEVFGKRSNQSDDHEGEIQFDRLKKLALFDVFNKTPDEIAPFTFKRLRELRIEHLQNLTNDWVRFRAKKCLFIACTSLHDIIFIKFILSNFFISYQRQHSLR